jgi:hypothetical protein
VRLRCALAAALGAAVLAPAGADAHSIVRVIGGELSYQSIDAVSLNTLTVGPRGDEIRLYDPTVNGGTDPGPCRPGEVTNDANAWIVEVFCPAARVNRVRILLGEREDSARVDVAVPLTLLGGPGADTLSSGASPDVVSGDEGNDRLDAGPGNDIVDGGLGIDVIQGGDGDDRLISRDGLRDRVLCGPGGDRVEADTVDEVDSDCESVARVPTPPPIDAGDVDDGVPPRVAAGASTLQHVGRRWRVRVAATSSERGAISASGFLDVAGLRLPLKSDRRRVPVAGGGVVLTVRLSRSQQRACRRAFARGRRVFVRLGVVATDLAGRSAETQAPRITLVR